MIELKSLEEALEYKAPPQAQVAQIGEFVRTPGSDRLHSFNIAGLGWTVISSNINQTETEYGAPRYSTGDRCIYIAIDSVLPEKLEKFLFPEGSKIKLDNGRVKILKLRNSYSEGMIVDFTPELEALYPGISTKKMGEDVSDFLGITKYEPPVSSIPGNMKGRPLARKNPLFKEYIDIRNIKHYSNVFEEGEMVYVSSKIHGTSVRAAYLPTHVPPIDWTMFYRSPKEAFIILKKHIKKKLGLLAPFEHCVGSRRVQLQNKPVDHKGFYESNVHRDTVEKLGLLAKLKPGEALYGEIYGKGIQKNYDYGLKDSHGFVAYDVMVNGRFLPAQEFLDWCKERGVPAVPNLGFIPFNREEIEKLAGAKVCMGGQKIREGVVVKSLDESSHPTCGRKVFKLINPAYLLADNTDFH